MSLPEHINPFRLARGGASLSGRLEVAPMSRIPQNLPHALSAAEVALHFYEDDAARPRVDGTLRAMLRVRCQRCLEPVFIEVRRDVRLMPVASDAEAAAVDPDYEPLLVEADSVDVAALVEDEVILSMPAYPSHPPGQCRPPASALAGEPHAGSEHAENPFEVLRSLKLADADDDG